MKKTAQFYKGVVVSFLLILAFGSCKKDSLESRELLVYLAGEYGSVNGTVTVPFVHNPVSITGNPMISIPAYATREVAADINVTIAADMSLVAEYNQKNNKATLPLPESAYRIINPGARTIRAGALSSSDSLRIEITSPSALTDPKGYLLPLTITSIESKDKGARASSNQRTVYVNVTYEYNNVLPGQTPMAGTLMSRTGWSTIVSNTTSGALGPAMIDGSNTTAWRSSNSTTAVKWATINMSGQRTIKAFQIVPNYVTTTENATQMTVSSSNDNVTWTVQGIWRGTGPAAGSSATVPDIKGVNFASPVTAQYFRFDITALVSGGRVGFAEVNAIQ